jgi:hypothetical protein
MARGSINHLALTASDLGRSTEFYDKVLGFMGYARVEVPEATQQLIKTQLHAWANPNSSITLRPAKGESVGKAHDRNAPGSTIWRSTPTVEPMSKRCIVSCRISARRYSTHQPNIHTFQDTSPSILPIPTASSSNMFSGPSRRQPDG